SAGTKLAMTPTSASITTSNSSIDASSLLTYLKTIPLDVCTAKYLPKEAKLDKITVVPHTVNLDLSSKGLPLTSSALSSKGSCS
ncbi:MAG: hypothetical protein JWP75_2381, partial [Frondihabitans sp.]|nr:hypothetical protein [Frondihabitans sp.]